MVRSLGEGKLDILVNNAGLWGPTPLGSTTAETLESMLDVNVKAVFWLTQALLPHFREGARIVNVSSIAGRIGRAGGRSVYGAAKAAVDAFTRNWALELAPRRIRVNAVAPGYVETDMTAEYFADKQRLQHAIDRQPFGRLAHPFEVADVVLFLCSSVELDNGRLDQCERWIRGIDKVKDGTTCTDRRRFEPIECAGLIARPPSPPRCLHPNRVRQFLGAHRGGSFRRSGLPALALRWRRSDAQSRPRRRSR